MLRKSALVKPVDEMERDTACRIYEQYWQHARHVENELLSFVALYTALVGGALYVSTQIGNGERAGAAAFIGVLSVFGFLFNYNLRIPFVTFTHLAELIAIRELGLKREYWRFFAPQVPKIDTYDIFAVFFVLSVSASSSAIALFLIETQGNLCLFCYETAIIVAPGLVTLVIGLTMFWWTRLKLTNIKCEIETWIPKEDGDLKNDQEAPNHGF